MTKVMLPAEAAELLPCPFCGGEGKDEWRDGGRAHHRIYCQTCQASTGWANIGHDASAYRDWNTRAAPNAGAVSEAELEKMAREMKSEWHRLGGSDFSLQEGMYLARSALAAIGAKVGE